MGAVPSVPSTPEVSPWHRTQPRALQVLSSRVPGQCRCLQPPHKASWLWLHPARVCCPPSHHTTPLLTYPWQAHLLVFAPFGINMAHASLWWGPAPDRHLNPILITSPSLKSAPNLRPPSGVLLPPLPCSYCSYSLLVHSSLCSCHLHTPASPNLFSKGPTDLISGTVTQSLPALSLHVRDLFAVRTCLGGSPVLGLTGPPLRSHLWEDQLSHHLSPAD